MVDPNPNLVNPWISRFSYAGDGVKILGLTYPAPPSLIVIFIPPPLWAGDLPTFRVNEVVVPTDSTPIVALYAGSDPGFSLFCLGYEWLLVLLSWSHVNVNAFVEIATTLFAFNIPEEAADTNVWSVVLVEGTESKTWIANVLTVVLAIDTHLLKIGSVDLGYGCWVWLPSSSHVNIKEFSSILT